MSADEAQPVDDGSFGPPGQQAGGPDAGFGGPGEPSEAELRAAYEAELARLNTTDVMAQTVVSLLNLGARRLGPPGGDQAGGAPDAAHPERDLEQARDAIDAVRALLEILDRRLPRELAPLRDALSRLQMAYAREVGAGAAAGAAGAQAGAAGVPAGAAGAGGAGAPAGPGGTSGGGAGGPERAPNEGAGGGPAQAPGEQPKGPGPAESSGRLWVPGR